MNKKKLIFIVNVDWFFVSHRLPIALKAIADGYEVHLICAITDKDKYLKSLGVIVHPFAFSRSGKKIIRELACIYRLYRLLKCLDPDLIHLITIKPVLYGGMAARLAHVPAVVSAISGLGFLFVERKGVKAGLLRYFAFFLYRIALGHSNQRIIFQNPADMNAFIGTGGVPQEKARIIRGSGVALDDYPMRPESSGGAVVVIMASRLLKDKGVCEFVEAARIVKSKRTDVHFKLIGEPDFGNPASVTVEQVKSWQAEGLVDCLGFRRDIATLFSQAHIIILPSYREGLPKVLIEAAACGRAVITTDVPGCRDAIEPDVSGLLVPPRDAVALAQAIERLLQEDVLRRQMGQAGRELAEREFSIEKVIAAHLAIYQELLDGNLAQNITYKSLIC